MTQNEKILNALREHIDFYNETVPLGIEKNRKGDAKITVTDKNGAPIPDATVRLVQKNHEFRFGANLLMLDEFESEEKNEKYRKYFSELFNIATLPFYWNTLEPERGKPRYPKDSPKIYRRPAIDLCMEFCEENGIEPREHALAYDAHFPEWLRGLSTDEVKRELERRYSEISERYADRIPTIEVTNEMGWAKGVTSFYDEPDFIEWCFKTAEKHFPNNELCINESSGMAWLDNCRTSARYYAYTEAAMLKGARIDAVGLQYHIFTEKAAELALRFLDMENLYRKMNLYSNLGKPLQITEITIPSYSWEKEDEEVQAEIIEKLYSLWFSHPNVEQIIYWNMVDGYAHLWTQDQAAIKASQGNMTVGENIYHGGLLRYDLTPKPAYLKIKELLTERWHTECELLTDADGHCSFRGFYGDYDVEITVDGKTESKSLSLSKNKNNEFILVQ